MPRYVEIDDVEVSDYVTVWDCNCSEFGRQTVMAVDDLQYLPTADVVPKSEYDRLYKLFKDMTKEAKGYLNRLYGIRADVANKIFAEIEQEIKLALESNYKVKSDAEGDNDGLVSYVDGKIHCLRGLTDFITELKKKYTESENG